MAGHETTTNLICNGLVELFRHPDQLEMVRRTNEHDANLIEEVLRFNSPVQMTPRIPDHDIEVAGTTIPGGSVILLCAVSANRDPRKFGPTADEVGITCADAKDQVSFGGGPHFCLGAALARLEGQIAIPRIIRCFSNLALAAEAAFEPRVVLRSVARLDVTVCSSRMDTFDRARLDIGRLHHPLDSEETAEFNAALGPISASAEATPGLVWRLVDDTGLSSSYVRLAGE